MAKWTHASVLDGGYDLIRTLAGTASRVKMHVIKAYSAGDSYATVISNSCGSVDMVAGDFVASGAAGANRTQTVGAKAVSLSGSSGAGPDLHVALVDSTGSTVLDVTDETSNQVITAGGTFNVPSWTHAYNQPT